jgi:hypothetical protein
MAKPLAVVYWVYRQWCRAQRSNEMSNEVELEPEAEAAIATPRSVVRSTYKARYAEREAAMARRPKGVSRKALARSSGDWLAVELAKLVLDEKSRLVVGRYVELLDANGVEHAKYSRTTKGWQGRLRMSTRLALERVVAAEGALVVPGGEALPAPRAWVAAHTR